MTRHMLWSLSADDSPENAHVIESKLIDSRGVSDDAKEGVMSFLEKRRANFTSILLCVVFSYIYVIQVFK